MTASSCFDCYTREPGTVTNLLNVRRQKRSTITITANKKHIKNLLNEELTNDQINLLTKGFKFIPTPVTKQTQIRHQLLCDFDQFARRMVVSWCCGSPNDVTFRPFCVSHHHKVHQMTSPLERFVFLTIISITK